MTRYDDKIGRIRAGRYGKGDFVIADAKDADMSGGIMTTGLRRDDDGVPTGSRTRLEFIAEIETLIRQDIVDIMLTSASNMELLRQRGAFAGSLVKPAIRANDATDVWGVIRGGRYRDTPSRPFRSVELALAQAELCLYSITFNNDADADLAALRAFADFRREARAAGKKYFLEVFNPNAQAGFSSAETGAFVNDCIVRSLAGLTTGERPEFLKVAYNGARAMEELATYDPSIVVGVLGGGSGTHRDTFELVAQAEKYGARLALFGRKINSAEHQPSIISWLRRVADGDASSSEAVRGYHGDLLALGLRPDRALDDDLVITEEVLNAAIVN
ncbi:hypothetical protein [Martelella sp. AMO21009]